MGEGVENDVDISIHSLRMEGDYMRLFNTFDVFPFQSTPSAWRETVFFVFVL